MSFRSRSRSRTVQPTVQRRSLSGSRMPTTTTSYSSSRPLSSAYPSSFSPLSYVSPYMGSSRENLYNSPSYTRSNYYSGSNGVNRRDSYGSTVLKNAYADRYVSPYTSNENGIITAGLSIKSSLGNGSYTSTNKSPYVSVYANKGSGRYSANLLSTSNTSLNSYGLLPSTVSNSNIGRSQSFKDYDRKNRSVRQEAPLKATRSLSISSERSEGYEVRTNNTNFNYFDLFVHLI